MQSGDRQNEMGARVHGPGMSWDLQRPFQVFADESEVGGFSIFVVMIRPSDVDVARRFLRRRLRRGQRSIHFAKERNEVRRAVLVGMEQYDLAVRAYRTRVKGVQGRRLCLRGIARDLAATACTRIVLDRNDPAVKSDNQILRNGLGTSWGGTYDHLHDHEEILLSFADGVAWAWHRGGPWRLAVEQLDFTMIEVQPA